MNTEPTMTPTALHQLRNITALVTKAGAALVPIASDGKGMDSHNGRVQDPEGQIAGAVEDLIAAVQLAVTSGFTRRPMTPSYPPGSHATTYTLE
jgi:hypothetical protein